jgi:hypothetical protein
MSGPMFDEAEGPLRRLVDEGDMDRVAREAFRAGFEAGCERTWARAIEVLRAVNWGYAADYLAKHPDPPPERANPGEVLVRRTVEAEAAAAAKWARGFLLGGPRGGAR